LVARNGRLIANYEQPKSYRDWEVWQRSIELSRAGLSAVGKVSAGGEVRTDQPTATVRGLGGGEYRGGSGRQGTREFLQFLGVASGSLAEAETFLILAARLGLLSEAETGPLLELAAIVGRMLNGLKRSLRLKL
jgi:four helix bundle protein